MEPAGPTISGCPWPLAIVLFVAFMGMSLMAGNNIRQSMKEHMDLLDQILQLKLRLIAAGTIIRRLHFPRYVDDEKLIDAEMLKQKQWEQEEKEQVQ